MIECRNCECLYDIGNHEKCPSCGSTDNHKVHFKIASDPSKVEEKPEKVSAFAEPGEIRIGEL